MIQIFITGGTFDKSYDYINGELFFEKTHLPNLTSFMEPLMVLILKMILIKELIMYFLKT